MGLVVVYNSLPSRPIAEWLGNLLQQKLSPLEVVMLDRAHEDVVFPPELIDGNPKIIVQVCLDEGKNNERMGENEA